MWLDWWPTLWQEVIQTLIGSLWISIGLMFILFYYHYFSYYHKGFRLSQRSFELAYRDLDKIARSISVCFLLYLISSYIVIVIADTKEFLDCFVRGSIFCAVVLPVINSHFDQ